MNPTKISFFSSILYDKYGNDQGQPVLVLEDIFFRNTGNQIPLENIFFRDYSIYHMKRMEWENFPFQEKSLLEDMQNRLEEILLSRDEKWILISQGYSSGFALHLALQQKYKFHEIHLLSPILFVPPKKETADNYSDFWNWWTSGPSPFYHFYLLPSLAEFFWKYLKLISIHSEQDYSSPLHFWFTDQTPQEESVQIQMKFPNSEINRVDQTDPRTMLQNRKIQRILSWKISKKWVP